MIHFVFAVTEYNHKSTPVRFIRCNALTYDHSILAYGVYVCFSPLKSVLHETAGTVASKLWLHLFTIPEIASAFE